MDQRTKLRAEIDETTEALTSKLRALEERATEIRESFQHAIDLDYQAQTRPWTVIGSAIGVGFVLGWLAG